MNHPPCNPHGGTTSSPACLHFPVFRVLSLAGPREVDPKHPSREGLHELPGLEVRGKGREKEGGVLRKEALQALEGTFKGFEGWL